MILFVLKWILHSVTKRLDSGIAEALKMHFEAPHNEIKCLLSIIESYSIEKNGSKSSHLLTVRAEVADPRPPYGQPDRKISAFFTPPQSITIETNIK